jgi:hypothetical protein
MPPVTKLTMIESGDDPEHAHLPKMPDPVKAHRSVTAKGMGKL